MGLNSMPARTGNEVHPLQRPARLGDPGGQLAQGLLAGVELDSDRDAVLGADGAQGPDDSKQGRFRPGAS